MTGEGYPTGNFVCAACSFLVAGAAVTLRVWYGRMNAKGQADTRDVERVWAY